MQTHTMPRHAFSLVEWFIYVLLPVLDNYEVCHLSSVRTATVYFTMNFVVEVLKLLKMKCVKMELF